MHSLRILIALITQQLGDSCYFSVSGQFCSQGSVFSDFKPCILEADLTPRQQEMTMEGSNAVVVDNIGLSLLRNLAFNSLLASLFPRLTNAFLVTRVARYREGESRYKSCVRLLRSNRSIRFGIGHYQDLYAIGKPIIWYRCEASSALLKDHLEGTVEQTPRLRDVITFLTSCDGQVSGGQVSGQLVVSSNIDANESAMIIGVD